ncbi:MAG: hypothetical protein HVN35_11110 [Methanobacteriaceae archaeon]|nr:hypothetical protein [Methanobacteriaceae archaeon]
MNLETPKNRLLAGIILFIILIALCLHYASEQENHKKYPSYKEILASYPQKEVVNVFGSVNQINNGSFQIEENYNGQMVYMTIISNTSVSLKDKITLNGVLGPDNQIVSVQVMEVNEYWKYIFLLFRSFLVLIFLIYVFNRYWQFNQEKFEFRRR